MSRRRNRGSVKRPPSGVANAQRIRFIDLSVDGFWFSFEKSHTSSSNLDAAVTAPVDGSCQDPLGHHDRSLFLALRSHFGGLDLFRSKCRDDVLFDDAHAFSIDRLPVFRSHVRPQGYEPIAGSDNLRQVLQEPKTIRAAKAGMKRCTWAPLLLARLRRVVRIAAGATPGVEPPNHNLPRLYLW